MRDVGTQLAEYFEAGTERIDAADVFAAAEVQRQLTPHRAPHRQWRPAWALAAGFLGVLILIGGVTISAWLAQRPESSRPATFGGRPVADAAGGSSWWPVLLVGAAVVAGAALVLFVRHRRATKEVEMQAMQEKQQEAVEATPRRSRRAWFIGLAVLVVLAGAIATWAIVEANQKSDIEIAEAFADASDIAWTTGDTEAWVAMFTEDGIYSVPVGIYKGRDRISRYVRDWGYFSELSHGEVTEVEDGVFSFPVRGVLDGTIYEGELRMTLEGDLVSHAVMVTWSSVSE